MEADFIKVGLIVVRDGRLLLCRKRTLTSKLILPGGRIEAGESHEACLQREVREELGASVTAENLAFLGMYRDRAASDDPHESKTVEIHLYGGDLRGEPVASSEIDQLVWFGDDAAQEDLSPILVNHIIPDLLNRRLLPWKRL